MALYKGFVEVSVAGAAVRRYLLDLDLSVLFPGVPQVVNSVDVDGATPRPDLLVRTTVHTNSATDSHVEIHLEPVAGRTLVETEVRVFLNTDSIPGELFPPTLFPVTGAFPAPSHWVYVAYRGEPGQAMPASLTFHLSERSFPAEGAPAGSPLTRDDVDIVVTCPPVTGPLHLEGGRLEGPLELLRAREPLLAPQFADGPELDVRGIALDAPVATSATITVATPSQPTFPLECLWVGIATDHLIAPPAAPVVAVQGSAGAVDAGSHRYKVSYVLANGNETKVGPASHPVAIADPATAGRVEVQLPIGPPPPAPPSTEDPGLAVVGRRVYRTVASATGDDGEYLRVAEVADNTATAFVDDRPDAALVEPPADRLVVHYSSHLRHDLSGSITLREPGSTDVYEAVVDGAPTDARVTYRLRPPAGRSRVVWQADAVVDHLEVRVPTLASGEYRWCEARADDVPQVVGGHWFLRGSDQLLVEVGDATRGRPVPGGLGPVQVVLASDADRPWREAQQSVVVELVETWFSPSRLEAARLRVAVDGLRRARFDLGLTEGGTARHARAGEGLVVDVDRANRKPGPLVPRFPTRPAGALRGLVRLKTYDDAGTLSDSHASVRVGELPRRIHLDLRSSPADAVGGEYLGAHLEGDLRRVKVLSLTDPSADRLAYAADSLRAWVTAAETGELDVVRAAGDVVVTTGPLTAEASVRHPDGLTATPAGGDEPFRHVKGSVTTSGDVRVGPAVVALGAAGVGTTASTLVDGHVELDGAWVGGSVRYLSGPAAGQVRTITSVATDASSATTDPFGAAPAAGDRYAIEVAAFDGLSLAAAVDGGGISGRVGVSRDLDRFTAVGATPQLRIRNAPLAPGVVQPALRSISTRVYGVRAAGFASPSTGPLSVPVSLDPERVNRAFRAELRELDERFDPAERDLAKGRLEVVPDDLALRVDLEAQRFEWRAAARSGRAVFWAEPGLVRGPDAGIRHDTPAGIGLIEGEVDGLPRWVRLTLLPSPALPPGELVPRNFTPPSGWSTTGFKAEVSEMASIEFLRVITWSRDDRDDQNRIHWGHLGATFLRWDQESPPVAPDPAVLSPLWIWLYGEDDPADEDERGSGLGFRISPPGSAPRGVRVTLDLDQAGLTIAEPFAHWRDLSSFTVGQELQMRDYAGEVALSSSAGGVAGGDAGAGPGEWFLRIIDGRPWYVGFGSAYFGNTGVGSPFTLPRIFT